MPGCQSVVPLFHELKKECKWKTNGLQHFSISYIVYVRPMNQNNTCSLLTKSFSSAGSK